MSLVLYSFVVVKKFLAYLVLFAVVLIVVPRDWVHDCVEDHIEADGHEHNNDSEDCFVCELDLGQGNALNFQCVQFFNAQFSDNIFEVIEQVQQSKYNLFGGRAPPMFS